MEFLTLRYKLPRITPLYVTNMNTHELLALGTTFVKKFIGVYPLDRLPPLCDLPQDCSFIVNTHTHNLSGEHWLAVKINMTKINVFDPMGMYYPPKLVVYLHRSRKHI